MKQDRLFSIAEFAFIFFTALLLLVLSVTIIGVSVAGVPRLSLMIANIRPWLSRPY